MSNDEHFVEVPQTRKMPSWWTWAINGLIIGLLVVFEAYTMNHWIVYALTGVALVLNYTMRACYNEWVLAYNALRIQQVSIETVIGQIQDGTFPGIHGLTKDDKEKDVD